MYEFLSHLARRKYSLYRLLYVSNPQARTNQECLKRIELKSAYEEICGMVESLPRAEKEIVDKQYKELASDNS